MVIRAKFRCETVMKYVGGEEVKRGKAGWHRADLNDIHLFIRLDAELGQYKHGRRVIGGADARNGKAFTFEVGNLFDVLVRDELVGKSVGAAEDDVGAAAF